MDLFYFLYRQSKQLLLLAAIAGAIGGVSASALVTIISRGVNGIGGRGSLALIFFVLCTITLISKSISEIALLQLTQRSIFRLRIELSKKLLATPAAKLQTLGKHGLMVILTKDVDTFIQAFRFAPIAFVNSVVIIASLAYLAWLSGIIFIIFTTFLVVSLSIYRFVERIPLESIIKIREQLNVLHFHFHNLVEGSRELQINRYRGVEFIDRVIAPDADKFMRVFTRGMSGYICIDNAGMVLFYVVIGLILFLMPIWAPQQPETLTTATLILLYLVQPIVAINSSLPTLRQASIALRKIQQLEGELGTKVNSEIKSDPFMSLSPARLQMKEVCHQYTGGAEEKSFMLGPIDITVNTGEILFIVGGNGSGKTTLAMLLLGLYAPEKGEVVLNEMTVNDENRDCYRQHFSAVLADFHLFEQLIYSEQEEVCAKALHYVTLFEMDHKVSIENGKFSSINLSTGQRKRLALVSSYLEDRSIYLFDEWAADQDPSFKRIFYTQLLPDLKARGKIVIVITHDEAYFGNADRIVKLENGKLLTLSID